MARLMDGSTLHEITAVPRALLRHRPAERHQQTEVVVTRRGRLAHRLRRRHLHRPQPPRPRHRPRRSAGPVYTTHTNTGLCASPAYQAPPEWWPAPDTPREGVLVRCRAPGRPRPQLGSAIAANAE